MSDKCGRCGMPPEHEVHQGVFGEFHEFDWVRPEIRALVRRGNVTPAEVSALRSNSWEWEAIVPALNDEAFVERMEYALKNCLTKLERPFTTYNQAVEGLYAPELIRRFKNIALRASAADDLLEAIDGHCGYKEQIGWLREALKPFVRDGDTFITGDMSSGEECVHADSEDVKRAIAVLSVTSPPATTGDAECLSAGNPSVTGGGFLRTPEGPINNCALANNDVEQNCQVCNGRCPDREAFALAKEIAKKPGVYESTLTDHVFPELFSGKK